MRKIFFPEQHRGLTFDEVGSLVDQIQSGGGFPSNFTENDKQDFAEKFLDCY